MQLKLKINYCFITTCAALIFSYQVYIAFALNDSNDLVLSAAEKNALDKFKPQVWRSLKEQFMKSDYFLIRWIRRAGNDVQQAKSLLFQTLTWREANNITNIMSEDWSDFEQDYQMSFEGRDKKGRPLLFINLGDWDLRAAVIHGKIRRLQRYLTYSTERSTQAIFEAQKEGKQVTRLVVLVDTDGVNLLQQGCPLCISFLVQWALDREIHYPDFTDETIIINAPVVGSLILNAVRAVMSSGMSAQTRSFDANRRVWMQYLDQRIDRDQRTSRYGGTKN